MWRVAVGGAPSLHKHTVHIPSRDSHMKKITHIMQNTPVPSSTGRSSSDNHTRIVSTCVHACRVHVLLRQVVPKPLARTKGPRCTDCPARNSSTASSLLTQVGPQGALSRDIHLPQAHPKLLSAQPWASPQCLSWGWAQLCTLTCADTG